MQVVMLFCLLLISTGATAASISGSAGLHSNSTVHSGEGSLSFAMPTNPLSGFNFLSQLENAGASVLNNQANNTAWRNPLFGLNFLPQSGGGGLSTHGIPTSGRNFTSLPEIPSITSLVPQLPNVSNTSSIFVPPIPRLPSLPLPDNIFGLSRAIQLARNNVQSSLGIGNNIIDGIQTALQQAFTSNDPTCAVRTLINVILDAYLAVATNNPMIVIAYRVLQEGIRLATEIAQAARNIILGGSTFPIGSV